MNVAELERLVADAFTPGPSNTYNELKVWAPDLARRVIAAEKLVEAWRDFDKDYRETLRKLDINEFDFLSLTVAREALTAYEATR